MLVYDRYYRNVYHNDTVTVQETGKHYTVDLTDESKLVLIANRDNDKIELSLEHSNSVIDTIVASSCNQDIDTMRIRF